MLDQSPIPHLLFQLDQINSFSDLKKPLLLERNADQYKLIFISHGVGEIIIDDQTLLISPGKLFIVSPGEDTHIISNNLDDITFYKLLFYAIHIKNGQPRFYKHHLFPQRTEIYLSQIPHMMTNLERLFTLAIPKTDMEFIQRRDQFNDLLTFLLKQYSQPHLFDNPSEGIAYTIDYIQQHYNEKLSIKRLSDLAQLTSWQYSTIFQKITGKKPLDYLAEVRIDRAKQILKKGNGEPLREIARLVGYQDEYYFNRRFRQITGIPPKIYARSKNYPIKYQKQKRNYTDYLGNQVEFPISLKRILFLGETIGDLLALGIQPIGSYRESFTDNIWINHPHYQEQIKQIVDVGSPFNFKRISELAPDLIIMANPDKQKYIEMSKISPTVVFDTFAPLKSRLKTLADLFGKWDVVYKSLDQYQFDTNSMWDLLHENGLEEETASAIMYFPETEKFYLIGTAGLSQLIYHKKGFKPIPAVAKIIKSRKGYEQIQLSDIANYVGDRLFFIHPPGIKEKRETESLLKQTPWNELAPVVNRKVHIMDLNRGWSWDYLTNKQLLEELPHIINKNSVQNK